MASQVEAAQRMYDARADNYEDSWHPQYSARFIELLNIQPGQRVLSLACGTGLDAFLAADLVGETGRVVAVDISTGMLAKAVGRQKRETMLGSRIEFLRHSVTDLASCGKVQKGSFDLILCSNAFVLFDEPAEVVRGWKEYLKTGGVLAVDIPHEHNFPAGLLIERVVKRLGVAWPSNRTWVESKDSFKLVLEGQGFTLDQVVELENITGQDKWHCSVERADEQFDRVKATVLGDSGVMDGVEEQARVLFREEVQKEAVDGVLEFVDSLYVYLAHKT